MNLDFDEVAIRDDVLVKGASWLEGDFGRVNSYGLILRI